MAREFQMTDRSIGENPSGLIALVQVASTQALRHRRILILGLVAVAAFWFVGVFCVKYILLTAPAVTADLYLWAEGISHTDLSGHFLYVARYELTRHTLTLLQDHVEPSSALLPVLKIFGNIPVALIAYQTLAPIALLWGLAAVSRHFSGSVLWGLTVGVLALFHPYFMEAVIDGVGGFHHDSQFLVYGPLFLTFFLLNRPVPTVVFLLLFLGVKQDSGFFAVTFGAAVAVLGLPFGDYRRLGRLVALISLAYLVMAVFVVPDYLIRFPNDYANNSIGFVKDHPWQALKNLAVNFTHLKWHALVLYFIWAAGAPAFLLSVIPDIGMYGILSRAANLYYNFNVVVFLAFGTLITALWLQKRSAKARLGLIALAMQTLIAVPISGWHLFRLLHLQNDHLRLLTQPIHEASFDQAEAHIDAACSVGPMEALYYHFYRLPHWFLLGATSLDEAVPVSRVRTIVQVAPQWLSPRGLQEDPIGPFVAGHADQLRLIGHFGPLTVWENPQAPCLPWENK